MDPSLRPSIERRLREIGTELRTGRTIVRDVDRVLRQHLEHPPAMLATVPDRIDAALRAVESTAELLGFDRLAEQLSRLADSADDDDQARGRGADS